MKMYPNAVLLKRPFLLLLNGTNREKNVYLKRLTILAWQLAAEITRIDRKKDAVLTIENLQTWRFGEIADVLQEKNVSKIKFSITDAAILGDHKARFWILNRAIRVIIRELATNGIRNKELKCRITTSSAEGTGVQAFITIEPVEELPHRAHVKIEIGFNK